VFSMSPLGKFVKHSAGNQWFLTEALAWLCLAKLLLLLVPFRWIASRLGNQMAESPSAINEGDRKLALRVSWAIQSVALHLPLGFVCLPQAIAAKWMLRRRGLPSTLYLGLRKGEGFKLTAHAWLRVGDKILTGRTESFNHQVITTFGEEGSR